MLNRTVALSAAMAGMLAAGLAHADTLFPVTPNGDISGGEVISSAPGTGWFTSAPGQAPATITGTGVNSGGLIKVLNLAPNGTSTYSVHDNFLSGQGANASSATVNGNAISFVDTYVLNLPNGTASNFDVSFVACVTGFTCSGISNLSARLYQYTATSGSLNNYTVGGVGAPAAGGVVSAWSTTVGAGTADYTQFQNVPVSATEYVLQVTGLIQPGGGSFGGDLSLTAVPLPASIWLFLSALGGLGAISRRRTSENPSRVSGLPTTARA
jgi:hypothetical protein